MYSEMTLFIMIEARPKDHTNNLSFRLFDSLIQNFNVLVGTVSNDLPVRHGQ